MNENCSNKDMLFGMDEICPILRNVSQATVLKWYRQYEDLPIRKLGGQWVSTRKQLNQWLEKFVAGEISNKNHNRN
ncbi:MAG: helix-turn-helix domain-containing protein [Desulfobacteraceae bacterium]|nr:helix-turn-helix domain-containing protein [Desulfobacteraceae bacterium]